MEDFLYEIDWIVPLRREWLTPIFEAATFFGYPVFFFIAIPILYWSWRRASAFRTTVVFLSGAFLTFFLKDLLQDPRPPVELRIDGHDPDSFGCPSGHTLLSICFWGSIAIESRNRAARIAASALILIVAASRIYLGVHDLEDVIAGGILGCALLGASRIALTLLRSPDATQVPRRGRELRISGSAAILATIVPMVLLISWPNSMEPPSLARLSAGFLSGFVIGYLVESRRFRADWITPARTVLGVLIGFASAGLLIFAARSTGNYWILGLGLGLGLTLAFPAAALYAGCMRLGVEKDLATESAAETE